MASLFSISDGQMTELKGRLAHAGLTAELAWAINDGEDGRRIAKAMVAAGLAASAPVRNPIEITLAETSVHFSAAKRTGRWGFTEEDLARPEVSASPRSVEKLTVRSLRIRVG